MENAESIWVSKVFKIFNSKFRYMWVMADQLDIMMMIWKFNDILCKIDFNNVF